MGSEWPVVLLQDLAADVRNAIVGGPFGSNLVSKDYVGYGVPVIRGQNMSLGRYVSGDFVYVSPAKAQSLKANIARPKDLVFTQRGTLGQVALVPEGPWDEYIVSQSQMKITVNPDKADVTFLYYYFSSKKEIERVISSAIQTGVPHTNLTLLKAHPIRLPPLAIQHSVSRMLNFLDDKIELNRQMNTTLEAMAQALFKSWFVDFDPVIDNALAAGNPIPEELAARAERRANAAQQQSPEHPHTLPAAIRQQFPGRFVFTETMGWVPEGWEVGAFGHLIESTIGGDWGKPEQDDKHLRPVAIIRGTDIPAVKSASKGAVPLRWVEEKKFRTRELIDGDIVIEISGGSPPPLAG